MKHLLRSLVAASVVGAISGSAVGYLRARSHAMSKKTAQPESTSEHLLAPAPGRIEYVPAAALLAEPAKYEGTRIILAGRWRTGFEVSELELHAAPDQRTIRVQCDWIKLREPIGDFSPKEVIEQRLVRRGRCDDIIAEGTFHYHESGSGFVGSYFLIDRILASDPCETERRNPESSLSAQPGLLLNKPAKDGGR